MTWPASGLAPLGVGVVEVGGTLGTQQVDGLDLAEVNDALAAPQAGRPAARPPRGPGHRVAVVART